MSDFSCEVVPVILEKHPNADSLSTVRVFDGYNVIVRTTDWIGIDKGVYIPPDSLVPDTEQFKFLEGHLRIKAKKLRGIESFGMLVPVPVMEDPVGWDKKEFEIGDNVAEQMNIKHYEPELSSVVKNAMGVYSDPPPIPGFVYDIEPWQKYGKEFLEGEEVVITEKIHGTNARYTFQNGRMYCGSHNTWKKNEPDGPGSIKQNMYWKILESHPWVEAFCRLNPNFILYGEIFGVVQKGYNYGSTQDNPYQFRAFDVFTNGRFLDYDDGLGGAKSDFLVPLIYRGPYAPELILRHSEGMTMLGGNHIREGCVVKPVHERWAPRFGRVILKYVSLDYLEGKKQKNVS